MSFHIKKNRKFTNKNKKHRKFTTHYLLIYFYGFESKKRVYLAQTQRVLARRRVFLSPMFKLPFLSIEISMKWNVWSWPLRLKNSSNSIQHFVFNFIFVKLKSLLLHLIRWSFLSRFLESSFFIQWAEKDAETKNGKSSYYFFSLPLKWSSVCLICIHLYNRFFLLALCLKEKIYILKLIQNEIEN